MSDRDVNITIRGRNLSDPAFNDAKRNLTSLGAQATQAKTWGDLIAAGMSHAGKEASASSKMIAGMSQVGRAELERLTEAAKPLPQGFSLANSAAGLLKSTIGQFTVAGLATNAIMRLSDGVLQFAQTGTRLPAVQSSFNRLAVSVDQDSGAMLASMRGATLGMVSNYDLMLSANKAMLLGLPVTSDGMGELANAATVLGRAMGQDATKSLDDLITALGRSSPMILDNLGLTVKVGEANEAYAAKLEKTSDQLTDAEKKMAFYEAAMEAARRKTAELGQQTQTLGEIATTAWTQVGNVVSEATATLNVGLGRALSSARGFQQFFLDAATHGVGFAVASGRVRAELDALATSTKAAGEAQAQAIPKTQTYVEQLAEARAKVGALSDAKRAEVLAAKAMGATTEELTRISGLNAAALSLMAGETKAVAKEQRDATRATEELKRGLEEYARFKATVDEGRRRDIAELGLKEIELAKQRYWAEQDVRSAIEAGGVAIKGWQVELRALEEVGVGTFQLIDEAIPEEIINPPQINLFTSLNQGMQSLIDGMTGKNGFAGLMSNLGDSIINGFGNLLSGGLTSAINMGISLASQGIAKLASLVGNLFKSEESRKVNQPRDQFFEDYGGLEGLTAALMTVNGMTAAMADNLIRAVYGAKTEEAFLKAKQAITDLVKPLDEVRRTATDVGRTAALSFGDVDEKVQELIAAIGTSDRGLAAEVQGLSVRIRQAADNGVTDFSQFGSEVERLRSRFDQASGAGVVGFQNVWQAIQQVDEAVGEENHGLSRDLDDLRNRIEAAAQSGVTNFSEFAAELDGMKERMREPVEFTVTQRIVSADPGNNALYEPYGGRQALRNRIDDWIRSNPGDWNRMDRALGIPMNILMGAYGSEWGTFHEGGRIRRTGRFTGAGLGIDEVPIIAQAGEYMVSRRGVAAAGGTAALDRLNAGQPMTTHNCTVIVVNEQGATRAGTWADTPERLRRFLQELLDCGGLHVPQRAVVGTGR